MNNKGFTLIEMMIVVAIVGVIAAIAIPNISKHLTESRRTDAIVALNGLQQAQAKMRSNCRWYADDIGTNGCGTTAAATEVDVSTTSESGYYTIAITANSASGTAYTATATAVAGKAQASDFDCQVFILTVNSTNPNGVKTSKNSNNVESTASTDTCWP